MALTDVNFQEGDRQDFVLEAYSGFAGAPTDIVLDPGMFQGILLEIPVAAGGGGGSNIFIMSE